MAFTVKKIISPNVIYITPNWSWEELNGNEVYIKGLDSFVDGNKLSMMKKLNDLLVNREVELQNPERISDGRLYCTVLNNNVDIAGLISMEKI